MTVERDDEHAYALIRMFVIDQFPDHIGDHLDAIADVIKSTGRNLA